MEAGIADGDAGELLNGLIFILAQRDAALEDATRVYLLVEVS